MLISSEAKYVRDMRRVVCGTRLSEISDIDRLILDIVY